MLVHDDIYSWKGFGGILSLAAGQCRLQIIDLTKSINDKVALMKPTVVVVSDLPPAGSNLKKVSVRSCASHIATSVARDFKINPQRMTYVEYTPASDYGEHRQHTIPAKYEVVDFTWQEGIALHPQWRDLQPVMQRQLAQLLGAE